ncbi:unnamed protein product [Allacma fusca]|uniref:Uncharacterized protein n=1 Tax=Allacma fusca TaxID=39272 RepID=A0A8J2NTA0_9HEXA|nr:unnamed protein product [Allacma fusca]
MHSNVPALLWITVVKMGSKLFLGFALLCLVGHISAFVLVTQEASVKSEVSSPEKRFFFRPTVITNWLKFCPFYMVLLGVPECKSTFLGTTAGATTTTTPAAGDKDKVDDKKDDEKKDDEKKDDEKKDDEKKDDEKKDDEKKDDEKKDDEKKDDEKKDDAGEKRK